MIKFKDDPIEWVKEKHDSFTAAYTSSSVKYTADSGEVYFYDANNGILPKSVLGIMPHVAKNAKEYEPNAPKFEIGRKPRFTHVSDFMQEVKILRNVYEVDMKSAYFQTLKKMDLVDKEMYDRYYGKKGPWKLARNMAVGTLKSEKVYYEFRRNPDSKSGLFEYREVERKKPVAPNTYWEVTSTVDNHIKTVEDELGGMYLFSWVDAIFMTGGVQLASDVFDDLGYETKTKKINRIVQVNGRLHVFTDNDKRVFHLPRKIKIDSL